MIKALPHSDTPAVSIRGVVKSYGAVKALKGIDLTVPQGQFFGLLGRNGAGKSTLINIMANLVLADQGEVKISGFDVVKDYRQARMQLGVVPQEIVYDPFFSVREMLLIQSGYFGLGKKNEAWVDEVLDRLHLSKQANKLMRALSGGMKRRLLIAQALVHRPPVIVLDEPTAGVDVDLRHTLWQFMQELHRQGHTIILTTHYLEEAESLCDEIAIIDHGEVVVREKKSTLLQRNPFRILRLTAKSVPHRLPEGLLRLVQEQGNDYLVLKLHREKDSLPDVLSQIGQAEIHVIDMRIEEPDLESVFLNLVSGSE